MKIEKVKIKEIKLYENNAKIHPEWQVEQIKNSIIEFGFNDPIAIDENNVIIEDIPFSSLCERHMLPFFGTVTVRYKPNGKVVGLSKIPRVIEAYSKRLQIQEQLTQQIAQALFEKIPDNQGVIVEINARHMCVELRGIRSVGNITKTTSRYGIYKE